MYAEILVYETDHGADNKRENAVDIVERKVRTDHEDNDYVRYKNEFYQAHGRVKNRYHRDYSEDQTLVIFLDENYEKPERKKRVFSSQSETAHAWAHHHEDSNNFAENGESGDGRVFYRGNSIYSYGHHFEMARILWDIPSQDQPVVLVNRETYSPSTSGHQSHVRSAIPHDWITFSIPAYKTGTSYYSRSYSLFDYGTNEENGDKYRYILEQWADDIKQIKEGISRKQKIYTLRSAIKKVEGIQSKAKKFIDLFQCKSIVPKHLWETFNAPVFDEKKEFWRVARRIIGRKQKWQEEKRQQYINQIKEADLHDNPEQLMTSKLRMIINEYQDKLRAIDWFDEYIDKYSNIQKWKDGGVTHYHLRIPSLPWGMTKEEVEQHVGKKLPNFAPVYLRKHPKKDVVQTTKGATIPVEDVKKAHILFQRYGPEAMEKSEGPKDFVKINGRVEIGNYTSVPAVNSEGTFRFACHEIVESEREYIVKKCEIE